MKRRPAQTIRVRLVPTERSDLVCLACGMFRTQYAVLSQASGGAQVGCHAGCIAYVAVRFTRQKKQEETSSLKEGA